MKVVTNQVCFQILEHWLPSNNGYVLCICYLTVSTFDLQEVAVNSYSCDEYTAVQYQQCYATCSGTSAAVFLYDSIDECNKHCESFHREIKHSYSVIIIAIVVMSASVSLCAFMDSIKQLTDVLPDKIIANGIIINVSGNCSVEIRHFCYILIYHCW